MRYIRLAALIGLLVLVAGCSSGDPGLNLGGAVTGKVTIDGRPVTAGTVLFVSENDKYAVQGPINEFGKYTVKEPPLGKCLVAVKTREKAGSVRPKAATTGSGGVVGSGGIVLPSPEEIGMTYVPTPPKFEDAKTSGLTAVIKKGNQEHDLPLTMK